MLSKLKQLLALSLRLRPLTTNATVYGAFYGAAEFMQQTFNKLFSPDKPDYEFAAGLRIVCVGSMLYAPVLYYWYKFLDKKFVGTSLRTVMTKVVCDQFILTPILLATFFILLSILEQKDDIFEELRHKFMVAFLANQTYWIPMQSINFYLVPPHLRVVYVAVAAFVWINVLCYIKRQQIVAASENAAKTE